ncbi:MAG: 16S rRNA (guanine(527)-N(7))-methyltransferase RsmG, partial [Clostridiales bacterium]
MKKFALRLETLLRQVEIDLTPEQLALAAAHWDLVLEANGSFNITGITEEAAAAEKHYLDCLLAVPLVKEIKPKLAVDIGSGGGFPGLVLAIAVPDTRFLLLEASVKKAAFLEQAIETLALPNVRVLNMRAEKAGRQGD